MEAAIKNELTDILRHTPTKEEILSILKEVEETGKSIIEVAQGKGWLEFLVEQDGKLIDVYGVQYGTLEDYRKVHPYRRIVIYSTPKYKFTKSS